jgi:large subunit ribosomal protein L32e
MKALNEMNDTQTKALIGAGYRTVDDLKGVTADELVNAGLDADLAQRVAQESISFKREGFGGKHRHLLAVRKRHDKPWFKRDDYEKKKKLSPSWRKPRGLFNKMRRGFPDKGPVVQVGYGAPSAIRGFHPSGFEEVLVNTPADLDEAKPQQAVRIGRTVGARKKQVILEKAFAKSLKVLNPGLRAQVADQDDGTTATTEEKQ